MAFSRCAAVAVCLAGSATAAELEVVSSGRFSLVSAGGGEGPSARAAGFVDATWQFETGAAAGFGVGVAAETDREDRFAIGGGAATAPLTGWRGQGGDRSAAKAALVAGYGFVRGGWGEASLGRDTGAAERFSLTLPSAFQSVGVADSALDPSGGPAIRLSNAPSGAAAKATVTTARFLGVNAGGSYAPRQDRDDLSQSLAGGTARLDEIWESGLSFARTGASGQRVEAAATFATARAGSAGQLASISVGLKVAAGPWTIGAAGLKAETARALVDYSAYGLAATWSGQGWTAMAGFSRAEDDLFRISTNRRLAGVSRNFADRAQLGLGLMENRSYFNGTAVAGRRISRTWLAELSVRL